MNKMTPGGTSRPDEPQPDLAAAVRRLPHANVLVVGDVMLDRYTYGDVTRISTEAPVPILTIEREVALPGGAGNVVRNLTALGAATAFISVVGDDPAGQDLTGLIGGHSNVEPWLLVQGGRTTTLKTRLLAKGQQLLRADREQTDPDPSETGRTPGAHRAGRDGGDVGHRAVGLRQGRPLRRRAAEDHRGRAENRPDDHRRSARQRFQPLRRRRCGDAEPPGTGRGL